MAHHRQALRPLLAALLLLAALPPACAHPERGHHAGHASHSFGGAVAWARMFEDPARDAWQKPDEVVKALALREDARVADIGSATGYFPVRFARAAPKGRVWGVDVEPSMVDWLNRRAETEGLANLVSILGEPGDAKLPEAVDLITVIDTYHHLGDRTAYFQRLRGSLKPGGRVAIIDFRKSSAMGPPADEKIAPETVAAELAAAGYAPAAAYDFLPEQFFLVFAR